jgi:hypothetical protein
MESFDGINLTYTVNYDEDGDGYPEYQDKNGIRIKKIYATAEDVPAPENPPEENYGTAKIIVAISNSELGVDEAPAVEKTFSVTVAEGAASITGSPLTLTAKIKVPASYTYTVTTSIVFDGTNSADTATGVYNTGSKTPDADYEDSIGTHEYSYPQQICMLFAKK